MRQLYVLNMDIQIEVREIFLCLVYSRTYMDNCCFGDDFLPILFSAIHMAFYMPIQFVAKRFNRK